MNLLVVDWDFFFEQKSMPDIHPEWAHYDWSMNESPFFHKDIWAIRASDFQEAGMELPGLTGEEKDFWKRFKFHPRASLFYSESNADAVHMRVARYVDEVWLYDAHHDAGYHGDLKDVREHGAVSCEDWLCGYYMLGVRHIHTRYPRWKWWAFTTEPKPLIPLERSLDDGSTPPVIFDRVFLCRSGSWVPPWFDAQFDAFVAEAPFHRKVDLGIKPRSAEQVLVDAKNYANAMAMMSTSLKEMTATINHVQEEID